MNTASSQQHSGSHHHHQYPKSAATSSGSGNTGGSGSGPNSNRKKKHQQQGSTTTPITVVSSSSASSTPPKATYSQYTASSSPSSNNNNSAQSQQQQPTKRQKTSNATATTTSATSSTTATATTTATPQLAPVPQEIENRHRDRVLFLYLNLVGQLVEVHTVTGHVYEGLFHTAQAPDVSLMRKGHQSNRSYDIVLKLCRIKKIHSVAPSNKTFKKKATAAAAAAATMASVLANNNNNNSSNNNNTITGEEGPVETFVINGKDIVQLRAVDITFATEKQQYRDESFVTDTQISNREFKVRDLVPWNFDNEEAPLESLDELTSSGKSQASSWDQYKINYQKFGVTSSYDETLYTTKLDRDSQFYLQKSEEAERIAREIEESDIKGVDSIHLYEERGKDLSKYSEEDLYSSVIRPDPVEKYKNAATNNNNNGPKKYVPPQQRQGVPTKTADATGSIDTSNNQHPAMPPLQLKKSPQLTAVAASENILIEPSDKKKSPGLSIATSLSRDRTGSVGDVHMAKLLPENSVAGRANRSSSFSTGAAIVNGSPTTDPTMLLKERMRIRQALTSSPVSSPRRSPIASPHSPNLKKLTSPFVGDAEQLAALSLDPAKPKVSEDVIHDFLNFSLRGGPKNTIRSTQKEDFLSFSKRMSTVIKDKPMSPVTIASPVTSSGAESAPTTQPKKGTILSNIQERTKFVEQPKPNEGEKKPVTITKPADTTAKKETKLNPNAPVFKFNPKAVAFNPSAPAATTTPPAATTAPVSSTVYVPSSQAPVQPTWAKPIFTPAFQASGWSNPKVNIATPIQSVYSSNYRKRILEGKHEPSRTVSHTWTGGKRQSYKQPEEFDMPMVQTIPPMPHFGYGHVMYQPPMPPSFAQPYVNRPGNYPPYQYQQPYGGRGGGAMPYQYSTPPTPQTHHQTAPSGNRGTPQ